MVQAGGVTTIVMLRMYQVCSQEDGLSMEAVGKPEEACGRRTFASTGIDILGPYNVADWNKYILVVSD